MAASTIPNLNTLRRGGLRLRGRGGTGNLNDRKSKDEIIQNTDNDAATSRLSAVNAGYLDDPFAEILTPNEVQRRLPLMNRGTYVRTVGIDRIVSTFIASHSGRKQIVSLGAGSDTRYFRLKRKYSNLNLLYHEFDFQANTKPKIERLKSTAFSDIARELCAIETDSFQTSEDTLQSVDYHIHPQDLRELPSTITNLRTDLPTLIISECCLIYLSPEEAENVLEYFTKLFENVPLAITIYEPIRPGDPFGKTMMRNLVARGIHLQTFEKYAELQHQRTRLKDYHFDSCAEDTDFIWREWVREAEKERIENLEWMDEVEEFILLAKHYCISWGWKGWADDKKWKELPASSWNAKQ